MNQTVINNLAAKINSKEQKSNKVTSLSSSSTDTQYPSAKAVYDALAEITANSGGNYIYDFYLDSSNDDIVLEYDSASGGGSDSSDILGTAFYNYELTSSTYNPTIDTSFTITCKVTNVFDDNVGDKSITLYKDGTSVSSATTNVNGVATWTVTLSDWDIHQFKVANATLELKAKGWKTLVNDSGYLIRTKDNVVQFNLNVDSVSFPTTFTAFGGGAKVPTGYRPYGSVVVPCKSNYPLFVAVRNDGTVERRTFNSSQQTAGCYAFCEWTI